MKIMVVDDDPIQCKITAHLLQKANHEVIVLDNAESAQEMLKQEDIHFVITDWIMPGLDGPSFVKWIRSADFATYIYIIFVTSRDGPGDIADGLNIGADDYVKKPFNPPELLARVAVGERILRLEENLRIVSKRMEEQALIDDLTNLMNRRALYQISRQEFSRAKRQGIPVSILFLDLDKLKHINDTYGHQAGDEALKLVARLIRSNIREYDQPARWGGDEFLVLLPDANADQASIIIKRIQDAFSKKSLDLTSGDRLTLKVSMGLHTWSPNEDAETDLDVLVRKADTAMYTAKQSGSDQTLSSEKKE